MTKILSIFAFLFITVLSMPALDGILKKYSKAGAIFLSIAKPYEVK